MPATNTSALQSLQLALGERSYQMEIGPGLLARGIPLAISQAASKIVVVSNDVVFPLYGDAVMKSLLRPADQ